MRSAYLLQPQRKVPQVLQHRRHQPPLPHPVRPDQLRRVVVPGQRLGKHGGAVRLEHVQQGLGQEGSKVGALRQGQSGRELGRAAEGLAQVGGLEEAGDLLEVAAALLWGVGVSGGSWRR
jgi:hypothetical protein